MQNTPLPKSNHNKHSSQLFIRFGETLEQRKILQIRLGGTHLTLHCCAGVQSNATDSCLLHYKGFSLTVHSKYLKKESFVRMTDFQNNLQTCKPTSSYLTRNINFKLIGSDSNFTARTCHVWGPGDQAGVYLVSQPLKLNLLWKMFLV